MSTSLIDSLSLLQVEKAVEGGDWGQVGELAGKRHLLAGKAPFFYETSHQSFKSFPSVKCFVPALPGCTKNIFKHIQENNCKTLQKVQITCVKTCKKKTKNISF